MVAAAGWLPACLPVVDGDGSSSGGGGGRDADGGGSSSGGGGGGGGRQADSDGHTNRITAAMLVRVKRTAI